MRMSRRAQEVHIAQTELEIAICEYFDDRPGLDEVEKHRAVAFMLHQVCLDMEPAVKRAERFSNLKDLIEAHQKKSGLTQIEVAQALTSLLQSSLRYALRFERHGNYDKGADEE